MIGQIFKRVLGLRDKFGIRRKILIQKMDVKSSFRRVRVDPAGVANVGHVLGRCSFIDWRPQFGWRGAQGGGE